jgi:hypothetical protein
LQIVAKWEAGSSGEAASRSRIGLRVRRPPGGGRPSLPSMRMLHLGLRVSDLEQSLAFYTALGYAELGRDPETEFGSLTMI